MGGDEVLELRDLMVISSESWEAAYVTKSNSEGGVGFWGGNRVPKG